MFLIPQVEANDSHIIKWWVDGYYKFHSGIKSHTGEMKILLKGAAYDISLKQKINTKGSTEMEVVFTPDIFPQFIQTRYFLDSQEGGVKEYIMYQDNISSKILKDNRKGPIIQSKRHMDIWRFKSKYCIDYGLMRTERSPGDEVIGDFHTKPLPGICFQILPQNIEHTT